MRDFTVFSNDQLRKIARAVERETNLLILATEKAIQAYSSNGQITERVADEVIRLAHEADEEAEKRGLTEIRSYQFRKEYIQSHPFAWENLNPYKLYFFNLENLIKL